MRHQSPSSSLSVRLVDPQSRLYAARISNEQWDEYKEHLSFLHYQGFTRAEMLHQLGQQYGFKPSKQQLNSKMLEWGLRVYQKADSSEDPVAKDIVNLVSPTMLTSAGFSSTIDLPYVQHLNNLVDAECTISAFNQFTPRYQTQHSHMVDAVQVPPGAPDDPDPEPSTTDSESQTPISDNTESSTYIQERRWFSRLLASVSTHADLSRTHKHAIIQDLNDFADMLQRWPLALDQGWPMSEHLRPVDCVPGVDDAVTRWLNEDSYHVAPVLGRFFRWSQACLGTLAADNVSSERSPLMRIDVVSITQRLTCHIVTQWLCQPSHEAASLFGGRFHAQPQRQKLKVVVQAAGVSTLLAMVVLIELNNMILGPDYLATMSATHSDWTVALDSAFTVLTGLDEDYVHRMYHPLINCALTAYDRFRLVRPQNSPAPSVREAFAALADSLMQDAMAHTVVNAVDTRPRRYNADEDSIANNSVVSHFCTDTDFRSHQRHHYENYCYPHQHHQQQPHQPLHLQMRHSYPPSLTAHTHAPAFLPLPPSSVMTTSTMTSTSIPTPTLSSSHLTTPNPESALGSMTLEETFDLDAFKSLMLRMRSRS